MDYRKYGEAVYIRMDRGDEIISCVLDICGKENIKSATFSGIGGCSEASIQTFIPATNTFETQTLQGMLELVSLTGNVITDDRGVYFHHTHQGRILTKICELPVIYPLIQMPFLGSHTPHIKAC